MYILVNSKSIKKNRKSVQNFVWRVVDKDVLSGWYFAVTKDNNDMVVNAERSRSRNQLANCNQTCTCNLYFGWPRKRQKVDATQCWSKRIANTIDKSRLYAYNKRKRRRKTQISMRKMIEKLLIEFLVEYGWLYVCMFSL